MNQSPQQEIDLLRATLDELRKALPKCTRGNRVRCDRVTTFEDYDGGWCDDHAPKEEGSEGRATDWAPVARRLGW